MKAFFTAAAIWKLLVSETSPHGIKAANFTFFYCLNRGYHDFNSP
jgi:hypothetical protein